jgi:hypothetical protein
MGRLSRDKGARVERQIVALHGEIGVKAERVPLSGAVRYQGNGADVDVYAFGPAAAPLVCEVKARGNGARYGTRRKRSEIISRLTAREGRGLCGLIGCQRNSAEALCRDIASAALLGKDWHLSAVSGPFHTRDHISPSSASDPRSVPLSQSLRTPLTHLASSVAQPIVPRRGPGKWHCRQIRGCPRSAGGPELPAPRPLHLRVPRDPKNRIRSIR